MPLAINQVLENKLYVYRKVLVQEFIREFNFLVNKAAGRAAGKGDFTDKLTEIFKSAKSLGLGSVSFPGSGLADLVIDLGIDWINDKRHEADQEYINEQDINIDQEQLRILMEIVALEASRRYEIDIDICLSDLPIEAVVPLALTQVERMLEYVARNRVPLTFENLLTGIIAGHSGAFLTGWTNTKLITKHDPTIKKFTAEGLCGRPAFITANGEHWLLDPQTPGTQPYHKKPMHQRTPVNQTTTTFLEKIGYKKNAMFNYGYTKLIKKKTTPNIMEPKYYYVMVPQSVVTQFGYEIQPQATLSPDITAKMQQYQPIIQIVTRAEIEDYLKQSKLTMSFNDYIRQRHPACIMTQFEPNDVNELDFSGFDFSGADFSNCILIGIKITGSLKNTKFKQSYLVGADLSGVTNSEQADFTAAHMENLKAAGANLNGAKLLHAQLHYANLKGAQLQHVQHLGAIWVKAELADIKTDDLLAILRQQEDQHESLKDSLRQIQTETNKQKEAIEEIQTLIKKIAERMLEDKESIDENAIKLQGLLGELVQERQSRLVFERYCQAEFEQIKKQTKNMSEEMGGQNQKLQEFQIRFERLERSQQEHSDLLQVILNKLMEKEAAQQLFEQHCKTQFTELKSDIENSAETIKQQQAEILKLRQQLQTQLQQLQFSPVKAPLAQITKEAGELVKEIEKSNTPEYSQRLTSFENTVHSYVEKQTNKIKNINENLQQLQSSVEQLQQQINPTQLPQLLVKRCYH